MPQPPMPDAQRSSQPLIAWIEATEQLARVDARLKPRRAAGVDEQPDLETDQFWYLRGQHVARLLIALGQLDFEDQALASALTDWVSPDQVPMMWKTAQQYRPLVPLVQVPQMAALVRGIDRCQDQLARPDLPDPQRREVAQRLLRQQNDLIRSLLDTPADHPGWPQMVEAVVPPHARSRFLAVVNRYQGGLSMLRGLVG